MTLMPQLDSKLKDELSGRGSPRADESMVTTYEDLTIKI